jgi:hypothetical protein
LIKPGGKAAFRILDGLMQASFTLLILFQPAMKSLAIVFQFLALADLQRQSVLFLLQF